MVRFAAAAMPDTPGAALVPPERSHVPLLRPAASRATRTASISDWLATAQLPKRTVDSNGVLVIVTWMSALFTADRLFRAVHPDTIKVVMENEFNVSVRMAVLPLRSSVYGPENCAPVRRSTSTVPIGPPAPVAPVSPVAPVAPAPVGPVAPTPVGPVFPVGPVVVEVGPVLPVLPVGPVTADAAPVAPAAPVGPVAATAPVAPVGPVTV